MTIKKEILYPQLLECIPFTNDVYWKQIFEDMAYGITPYGVYIHKGFLCCNFKNKEFSYKIDSKEPSIMYSDIHTLLRKVGLYSINDKLHMMQTINKMESDMLESHMSKWNNIKKRTIRDFIIENYVIDMKKQHGLSDEETKKLYNLIQVGLIFKTVNAKTIQYKNGKIEDTTIFTFQDGKVNYDKIMNELQAVDTKIVFLERYDISNLWKKYVMTKESFPKA
jgi:hypothetical protein